MKLKWYVSLLKKSENSLFKTSLRNLWWINFLLLQTTIE